MLDEKLGKYVVQSASSSIKRMTAVIWGSPGTGKTTFACTAPGTKLILNLDPDGFSAVASRTEQDVSVIDLSKEPASVVDDLMRPNPLGLEQYLKDRPEIETVILDSATTLAALALSRVIEQGGVDKMTHENPTINGYGRRNAKVLECLRQIMITVSKLERHFIVIGHEDDPTVDKQGVVLFIDIMLGGKLTTNLAIKIGEIWWLHDTDGKRYLAVRPCRMRKPMKSRMFVTGGEPEFLLKYAPTTKSGVPIPDVMNDHTITKWYDKWTAQGYQKLEIPK